MSKLAMVATAAMLVIGTAAAQTGTAPLVGSYSLTEIQTSVTPTGTATQAQCDALAAQLATLPEATAKIAALAKGLIETKIWAPQLTAGKTGAADTAAAKDSTLDLVVQDQTEQSGSTGANNAGQVTVNEVGTVSVSGGGAAAYLAAAPVSTPITYKATTAILDPESFLKTISATYPLSKTAACVRRSVYAGLRLGD